MTGVPLRALGRLTDAREGLGAWPETPAVRLMEAKLKNGAADEADGAV